MPLLLPTMSTFMCAGVKKHTPTGGHMGTHRHVWTAGKNGQAHHALNVSAAHQTPRDALPVCSTVSVPESLSCCPSMKTQSKLPAYPRLNRTPMHRTDAPGVLQPNPLHLSGYHLLVTGIHMLTSRAPVPVGPSTWRHGCTWCTAGPVFLLVSVSEPQSESGHHSGVVERSGHTTGSTLKTAELHTATGCS